MSRLLPVLRRGPGSAAGMCRGSKLHRDLRVCGAALQRAGESISSSWALRSLNMSKKLWMLKRCRVVSSLSSGRSSWDVAFVFFKFYLFITFFLVISVGMQCSEAAPAVIPGAGGPSGQRGTAGLGSEAWLSHLKCQQEATAMRIRNKCFCLWSLLPGVPSERP